MADYIDREDLWRALDDEPFYDNADKNEIVLPVIDGFPAADVAPMRHGRLLNAVPAQYYGEFAECSVCGWFNVSNAKYCNGCGARPDGGAEDDL